MTNTQIIKGVRIARISDDDLIMCYLEWLNNFCSVDRFCEYYSISRSRGVSLINLGREANEAKACLS